MPRLDAAAAIRRCGTDWYLRRKRARMIPFFFTASRCIPGAVASRTLSISPNRAPTARLKPGVVFFGIRYERYDGSASLNLVHDAT